MRTLAVERGDRHDIVHEGGQVREIAPIGIDLGDRAIDRDRTTDKAIAFAFDDCRRCIVNRIAMLRRGQWRVISRVGSIGHTVSPLD